jgi:hypothetical protein
MSLIFICEMSILIQEILRVKSSFFYNFLHLEK